MNERVIVNPNSKAKEKDKKKVVRKDVVIEAPVMQIEIKAK